MKKSRIYIAIICMVTMAAAVAVVSCKKDTTNETVSGTIESPKAFDPSQITDMNAYLKDFKQKMQSAVKGEDETLSLEEAAWHLSCLANIDFCRINVEYNDFQFDTVDMQVDITNGVMLMSDFCMAYEEMCTKIQQFKKGFNHLDQNLYFIKVSLEAEGIALMTSYTINSKDFYTHQWYFPNFFDGIMECYQYFNDDSTYVWNGLGAQELERVLNLYEHHDNGPTTPGGPTAVCYIPTRDYTFNYTNTYDPYGSEYLYINDSRIFAKRSNPAFTDYIFDVYHMCSLLDSYLGEGYEYISDHLYPHEFPVNWTVTPLTVYNNPYTYCYHNLHVEYGRAFIFDEPTPED